MSRTTSAPDIESDAERVGNFTQTIRYSEFHFRATQNAKRHLLSHAELAHEAGTMVLPRGIGALIHAGKLVDSFASFRSKAICRHTKYL